MTSTDVIVALPYPEGIIRPIPTFPAGVLKIDEPEDLGGCRICMQRADGVHFSVSSCRACAAFFRRTVILKLRYSCKEQGDCRVEKSLRNLCRSCRYTRCLSEGMKIELVQLQRDSIGKKAKQTSPSVDPLFTPNVATSLSAVFKKSEEKEGTLSVSCPILSQMTNGYELFLKFRKSTNTLVHSTVITPTFRIPKIELHASRFDSAKQVCKVEAHLVTDIVNTYFTPFNSLKFEDKVALFKNFFCYFSHTDRAYQSFKQFENDDTNDKILMPDGGFIKRTELDRFYENAEGVHTTPEDAAKIFQPAFNYILDVIVDYMRRIHIVETEYLALLGFCLWDDAVPGLSKEARSLAVKTQAILLAELQSFYAAQNKTQTECTQRVGTLLLLVPKLTKCVIMLRENSVLAELFNYYEADVCCKNFKEDASIDLDCTSQCIVHSKNE